jgi:hypothetical protein
VVPRSKMLEPDIFLGLDMGKPEKIKIYIFEVIIFFIKKIKK